MVKVWVNGKFLPLDEVNVSVFSHSFGRGSGIFEFLDIVRAAKGPAFFALQEHLERFFNTANLASMQLPVTKEEIARALI